MRFRFFQIIFNGFSLLLFSLSLGCGTGVYESNGDALNRNRPSETPAETSPANPTILSIVPASGPATGGTTVSISGTGFEAGTSVTIGGKSCSQVALISSVFLTCITASHPGGSVAVVITGSTGRSGSLRDAYRYYPAPTVLSVSPTTGEFYGGKNITITGTGFLTGATITLGGVVCSSLTVINSTSATCITGAHALGTVNIVVTNPDGQTGTGASLFTYSEKDTWATMSTVNAPSPRQKHSAVWTGSLMIVFGGGPSYLNSGARYDPAVDAWSRITTTGAPESRDEHTSIWSGSKMVVFGGVNGATYLNTGGRYDPGLDSWTETTTTDAPAPRSSHSTVWSGSKMLTFGGYDGGVYFNTGGSYDPDLDVWTSITTSGAPAIRYDFSAVWTGTRMIVFGGYDAGTGVLNTGGSYDLTGDAWSTLSTTFAPSYRQSHSAVWAGTRMLVFGGTESPDVNTGGSYSPGGDLWTEISTVNAPPPTSYHTAVWTGSKMVVFGGLGNSNTGRIYDPETDTWTTTASIGSPSARYIHSAIWTGTKMLIFGGHSGIAGMNSGGVYCP